MISKNYSHLVVSLLLLTVLAGCKVQNKTTVNQESFASKRQTKKNNHPFISSIKTTYVLKDSSSVMVYLMAEIDNLSASGLDNLEEFGKKFKTNWILQPVSGIKEKLGSGKVDYQETKARISGDVLHLALEIPRLKEFQEVTLALEFIDLAASRKFTNQTHIDYLGKRPNNRFGLYVSGSEHPSFESFVHVNKPLVFKSVNGHNQKLYLKRFNSDSPAALSPMSTTKRDDLRAYSEQETIQITSGVPFTLSTPGTYVLLEDENEISDGFGFLAVNDRYPRLTMAEDLKEPLLYMSTNDEINALNETKSFKESLDLYFLAMTDGNQSLAKQIIKSYYRRVEKANLLFTTYKEGWKTDKGMIYLILGPPTRIQKAGQREVWLYAQSANFSEIIFTFYRKPNQFSKDHYELVRYPEYGAYWYPFVEAWRTGNVLE